MLFGVLSKSTKTKTCERLSTEIKRLEALFKRYPDFPTLQDLVDVYSVLSIQRAVEFFEAVRDEKYKQFSAKLQQLLMREDVQELLQRSRAPLRAANLKSAPLRGNPLLPFNTPTPGEEKSWVAHMSLAEHIKATRTSPSSFELSDLSWSSSEADSMIDSELNLSATTAKHLHEDIQSQKEKLRLKLRDRINRMSRKSGDFTLSEVEEDTENRPKTDRGITYRDVYETKLEALLERFVNEKSKITAEINRKYDEQVREIAAGGSSGIITKVIAQMKSEQDREIKEAIAALEVTRKQEIAGLRKELFQRDGSCC